MAFVFNVLFKNEEFFNQIRVKFNNYLDTKNSNSILLTYDDVKIISTLNLAPMLTMSGWPSGLRRQTQGTPYSLIVREHSGPRLRAWVQIPLLTKSFCRRFHMF